MNFNNLPFNWFDFVVPIVLAIGAQRGRKHGLSEELIPMSKWILIVVGCAFVYEPLGKFISEATVFSLLSSYMMAYFAMALFVLMLVALIKKSLGGKLLGSDVFGRGEYYFGVVAGAVRFLCMLIVVLAFLNARAYHQAEITAYQKYEKDVYGNDFFPTLFRIQDEVFVKSFVGRQVREYLSFLLIQPTEPQQKELKRKQLDLP
ncbi:MAG: hypothetical protein QOD03_1168 [Verrucomicrobiota bacterium]|jgi:uncharacterized membrane protein required for colicin V production